ncbi:MAG TPA: DUF3084 domain-containing protein [Firmicutes bacterium]|nr:DUF3084 domain-containing protein [Bacillota bacterium]
MNPVHGIILIFVIAVLGGVIALLGDRIGMKVGKKRLSLYGLRPKYTSMIITVFTGILISGSTLVFLTIVSENVRTALFELKEIQDELQEKTAIVQDLSNELADKQGKLDEVHLQQEETAGLLEKTESEYRLVVKNLEETRQALEKTQKELVFEQERLNNLYEITNDLREKNIGLEVEKERLFKEVQALSAESSLLRDNLRITKTGRLIFLKGDILLARVVQKGLKAQEIKEKILEPMLVEANKIALERGARLQGKEGYALKVNQQLLYFSQELSKITVPGVVRLVADRNTIALEPLYVSFQYFPNALVFRKNEIIAETQVGPDLDENAILDEILDLLLVVRKKSLNGGMISEGQYIGEIASMQNVPEIISKIRKKTKPSTIQLVALDDVWRIKGPVKVGIELKDEK